MSHCHFIRGRWVEGKGIPMVSLNPATEEGIWAGHEATEEDVNDAVAAAQEAFKAWRSTPLEKRIAHLRAFAAIVTQRKEILAHTIAEENGKPLWEALTEVAAMIGKIDLSIEAYHKRCPDSHLKVSNATAVTRHVPHGPVAVLGPFNFPAHLPNGHIAPALLAGNTVVFKPSEQTPRVAQVMMECWEATEIPQE